MEHCVIGTVVRRAFGIRGTPAVDKPPPAAVISLVLRPPQIEACEVFVIFCFSSPGTTTAAASNFVRGLGKCYLRRQNQSVGGARQSFVWLPRPVLAAPGYPARLNAECTWTTFLSSFCFLALLCSALLCSALDFVATLSRASSRLPVVCLFVGLFGRVLLFP